MLQSNYTQDTKTFDEIQTAPTLPLVVEVRPESELDKVLMSLSPEIPWGVRQEAARKIGYLADPTALPALLDVLPSDPFWMVRCAIIQALERIGDPNAIPTLKEVAKQDRFQVVRSYASKAIQRLTPC